MNFRPKFLVHIAIAVILIFILVQPAVLVSIQNMTPKELYPLNSLVITSPPTASYPSDLHYCYEHLSTVTVTVVFYNTDGNYNWMSVAHSEFARAGIEMIFTCHSVNATAQSYYDIEFENQISGYRTSDGSMLVIAFTNLRPQPSDSYSNLAGYSRVQSHLSIIFMPCLSQQSWAYYVGTHELAHLVGFFPPPNGHSTNPSSLMYSVFSGSNIAFDSNDIILLKSLHS